MSERKPNRKPKVLWILMYHGYMGWLPSMDEHCAWQTKAAAMKKIKRMGEKGKMYKPFKYVLPEKERG